MVESEKTGIFYIDPSMVEMIPIGDLKLYKKNAKRHPQEQIQQIINSINAFGMNDPIGIWGEDNVIVEGHGRYLALREMGESGEIPVIRLDHLTDEQRRAYALAHNQLTMNTDFIPELLMPELEDLSQTFEMADFGFDGFGIEDNGKTSQLEHSTPGSLQRRFIVPPFSVLDTKSGAWQERKKQWREILGNLSETRDGEDQIIGKGLNTLTYKQEEFTSNFDPVLAEIMYYWFCPADGKVIDPFGGEQTKGIVAGEMGLHYTGMEIRQEQVDLNTSLTKKYDDVKYICGDSNYIGEKCKGEKYDFCFTSPPYYDLEVYSKEDMSSLGTYEEFMEQYKNIFAQCYELLDDNSFCVVKVGEIRDKKTGAYRSFVPDTVKTLQSVGFIYYNEIILCQQLHIALMQCNNLMRNRKVAHVHQNVLVFYKGNLNKIQEKLPPIEYDEENIEE